MNQKVVALTILLIMVSLSICFTATFSTSNKLSPFTEVQFGDSLRQLTASVPIVLAASLHSNATQPLDQPTRIEINNFIKNNPGVHFRGICTYLGLSVGVVQYHLSVLK